MLTTKGALKCSDTETEYNCLQTLLFWVHILSGNYIWELVLRDLSSENKEKDTQKTTNGRVVAVCIRPSHVVGTVDGEELRIIS
jgi:hypothetical protein